MQIRQHMCGEQRLQNLPESLKVYDKGTREENVAQRKERVQRRKTEVAAQDEQWKANILYSYTDAQNNKITVSEKMFDMYGKIFNRAFWPPMLLPRSRKSRSRFHLSLVKTRPPTKYSN